MQIFIGDEAHELSFKDRMFTVTVAGRFFAAASLEQLLTDLKGQFDGVALPDAPYTRDLAAAEDVLRLGFKYPHVQTVLVNMQFADLEMSHCSPEEIEKSPAEWQKSRFRYYRARWTDENGKEQSQIFSELQLEALGMVCRKE